MGKMTQKEPVPMGKMTQKEPVQMSQKGEKYAKSKIQQKNIKYLYNMYNNYCNNIYSCNAYIKL